MRHAKLSFVLLLLLPAVPALAQTITVSSATPSAGAQGTLNLNVSIGGKGFKQGARSSFVVTGTTNPGGIAVNSTTYVSSTQLTANINIADTADLANFDIVISTADGRSGKGVELFSVQPKGTGSTQCQAIPFDSRLTLAGTLNSVLPSGAAAYTDKFGIGVRTRAAVLPDGTTRIVTAVANVTGKVEVFLLSANPDGTGVSVTKRSSLTTNNPTFTPKWIEMGDVNGDGIPDIGIVSASNAYVFVSHISGTWFSYDPVLSVVPSGIVYANYARYIAMGDLDGDGKDEVAVGWIGSGSGKNTLPGQVFLFKYNGTSFVEYGPSIVDPSPPQTQTTLFGVSVAIADVTGDSRRDVIVGATPMNSVYVFANNGSTFSLAATLNTGLADRLGFRVGAANLGNTGYKTIAGVTDWNGSDAKVKLYSGGSFAPVADLRPTLYAAGWGTGFDLGDVNGDGIDDFVVGVPNATTSTSCNSSLGATYAYVSGPSSSWTPILFGAPTTQVSAAFGWSVSAVNGYRLMVIGERGGTVGTVAGAGQVYIIRLN